MSVLYYSFLFCVTITSAYSDNSINYLTENNEDIHLQFPKQALKHDNKLNIKLYYECHCPFCREFESNYFKKTVEKLNKYLDIQTYPYGNTRTYLKNGEIFFECQHGPMECYGNKLHACSLDTVYNHTTALLFNSCMMAESQDGKGSDDNAADKCGYDLGIDSNAIKECAKGYKGTELLIHYGKKSREVNLHYVPYILVNDISFSVSGNFMQDICALFLYPPPPCVTLRHD